MQNAVDCLAKFYAENVLYTPRSGNNDPADVGTACHAALENYVREVYQLKETHESWDLLEAYYKQGYADTFGVLDLDADTYKDGLSLMKRWYDRTDLSDVEIVSMEFKDKIMFKTPQGEKRLTFIIDRVDMFEDRGKKIMRIVDYKTIRVPLTPEELETKVQARMYAMCAWIKYQGMDIDEFEIEFDLLRHDPVSVTYTVDQNRNTWRWLKSLTRRITEADESNLAKLESPGPTCGFCVRRSSCSTLKKNIDGGGIHSMSEYEMLQRLELIEAQMKVNRQLKDEIENHLLATAQSNNELDWENGDYEVSFRSRRIRSFDEDEAAEIMGPELAAKHMGRSMTLTKFDKLLKDDNSGLSLEQRSMLRSLIKSELASPKPKIKRKSGL